LITFAFVFSILEAPMAMQPSGKKSNFAGGKWKSTTQDRPAPPAPKPVEVAPPGPPKSLAERLPAMTDVQLLALQANATRVSQVEKDRKQAEAAELLPLIAAELEVRKSAKADAAVERKKGAAAKRASTRAAKLTEKSAREEEDVEEESTVD
jgi:hypothetical protein